MIYTHIGNWNYGILIIIVVIGNYWEYDKYIYKYHWEGNKYKYWELYPNDKYFNIPYMEHPGGTFATVS